MPEFIIYAVRDSLAVCVMWWPLTHAQSAALRTRRVKSPGAEKAERGVNGAVRRLQETVSGRENARSGVRECET